VTGHDQPAVGIEDATYVVTGSWPFPLDMLRRDGSRPATKDDRLKIERLSGDHAHDRDDFRKIEITLIGPNRPDTSRWESFDWAVPGDVEHAFWKGERLRRTREEALMRSALAKLDPEEKALVVSRIDGHRRLH
jgi:hypothetical protein